LINLYTNSGELAAATVSLDNEIDHDEMIREFKRDCRKLPNAVLSQIDPNYEPKKKQHHPKIQVVDYETLYRISDAGLLDRLHGINIINGQKIYYFDRCQEIRDIISKIG
jgi:hypothetical protein